MKQPVVTLEPCGEKFRHQKGAWHIVLPMGRLPDWIGLYRRLRDRRGGQFAQHYTADVKALEAFAVSQSTTQNNEAAA